MQREILAYFAKLIQAELGIMYSEANYYQLQKRLDEIVLKLGLRDLTELHRAVRQGLSADLKQLILDSATNNETSFFRDPRLFKAFEQHLLPDLVARAQTQKIRIWSAACSSAQEPYSLSMLIRSNQAQLDPTRWEILATDISSRILERAKKGQYSALEVQRGLTPEHLRQHFEKLDEHQWVARTELKQLIRFERLNLLEPFERLGKFDLIFCRNVLIYQSVAGKKEIITRLAEALNPDGWLVLGSGESLIGLSERFETVTLGDAIFYRIKASTRKQSA